MSIAFDDLNQLQQQVSADFGGWGDALQLDQAMIDTFADLTGDKQWIHTDPERAASGPFGATIAHGFLILSLLPAVRPPQAFAVTGHGAVSNYGLAEVRFLVPVKAGQHIHARSRLQAVEAHRRGTLLSFEYEIHPVDSQRPAVVMQVQLLYMP